MEYDPSETGTESFIVERTTTEHKIEEGAKMGRLYPARKTCQENTCVRRIRKGEKSLREE
jgi:hypothetical protein